MNINAFALAKETALYNCDVRSLNCTVSPPWGNSFGVLFHLYVFLFRPLQEGTLTCQPVIVERSWGGLLLMRANVRLGFGAFSVSTFVLPVLFYSVTAAPLCLTSLYNRPLSCPRFSYDHLPHRFLPVLLLTLLDYVSLAFIQYVCVCTGDCLLGTQRWLSVFHLSIFLYIYVHTHIQYKFI